MTIYDLLCDNQAILRRFHRNGVATDAIRFIPIYRDWLTMQEQGHKKSYAEAVLSEKYRYTERYIRMIIALLSEDVV